VSLASRAGSNVSELCRRSGISRKTGYTNGGDEGRRKSRCFRIARVGRSRVRSGRLERPRPSHFERFEAGIRRGADANCVGGCRIGASKVCRRLRRSRRFCSATAASTPPRQPSTPLSFASSIRVPTAASAHRSVAPHALAPRRRDFHQRELGGDPMNRPAAIPQFAKKPKLRSNRRVPKSLTRNSLSPCEPSD
jgi:hypothetical protein